MLLLGWQLCAYSSALVHVAMLMLLSNSTGSGGYAALRSGLLVTAVMTTLVCTSVC
jgi:hypothetical protein